jgi:FixJ family two-component response regulator
MSPLAGIVFLVDDDPRILTALARLLRAADFETRSFTSAEEFLQKHEASVPGCLVLDVSMKGMTGIELGGWLADTGCERPIIFLTGQGDIPMGVQAMKSGAVDFLVKPVEGGKLLAAVRLALDRDRADRLDRAALTDVEARLASLTPRENEILRYVIAGLLNKQIAAELGTSEKTVKAHRGRVMRKMGVRSVADLTRAAMRAGIVPARQASNR